MSLEVKIPSVGESITTGLISTWHKNDGETVKAGEVLLTLETDKVSTEIQAEKAGLLRIKVPAGTEVKIGEVVPTIEEGGSAGTVAPAAASAPAPAKATEPARTPKEAKKMEPAAPAATAPASRRVQATPVVRRIAQELNVDLATVTPSGPGGRITEEDVRAAASGVEGRREPLRGVRRVIAERMARAHREVAPVTWVETVNRCIERAMHWSVRL